MKFITEEDLRDLYKKAPFTNYEPEAGVRLTPGAKQFLSDRGIYMFDDDPFIKRPAIVNETAANESATEVVEKIDWKSRKLFHFMKSLEASFLLTEEELLRKDVCLAQSVIELRKQFSCIKQAVKNGGTIENLNCKECTGINSENFSEALEDCFELSEFHVQLEKGKEMAILHKLRCELQEIEPLARELFEGEAKAMIPVEELTGKVNQISNTLSQLICQAFGGKTCQRKK